MTRPFAPRRRPALLLLLAALAACADPGGDYPRLLPTAQILAEPVLPAHAGPATTDPAAIETALAARAAALRARAAALSGPVIEPELRAQMQRVRDRHA